MRTRLYITLYVHCLSYSRLQMTDVKVLLKKSGRSAARKNIKKHNYLSEPKLS